MVKADVAVFGAGSKSLAGGMISEGVDGPKVTPDASHFRFVNLMEEARLELSGTTGRGCDVKGFLAAGNDDFVADGTKGGGVDGTLGFVSFEGGQGGGVDEFGGVVTTGSDEEGAVGGELQVTDDIVVRFGFALDSDRGARDSQAAEVPSAQAAVLMASDEQLVAVSESSDSRLGFSVRAAVNFAQQRQCRERVQQHSSRFSHGRVSDEREQLVAVAECDCAHSRFSFDAGDLAAAIDFPDTRSVVAASGHE